MAITLSPSKLSDKLRAELDLPAGAPPPWQARLLEFGVPIDYRMVETEIEEPRPVEQAMPRVETRLSSQTGRHQTVSQAVTNDDPFRVRLGPKYATVFSEPRPVGQTSDARHPSADAQTPNQHLPKFAGAQLDMKAFYDYPTALHGGSKQEAQTRGVPPDTTVPSVPPPTSSAGLAYASHLQAAVSEAAVSKPQQVSCGSQRALPEEHAPALPGLPSTSKAASATRLRGSGWHEAERHSKSRKRSHADKGRPPRHESTRKSPKRPAGQSHQAVCERPMAAEKQQIQPGHGSHVASEAAHEHNQDAAGVDARIVYNTGRVTDKLHREVGSDDDDVIYVRTAQRRRHEVMDLVSDEDRPEVLDQRCQPADEAAIPVMETVHHDGTVTCQDTAIFAPQLQTFTQAEDISPAAPQRASEPASHDPNLVDGVGPPRHKSIDRVQSHGKSSKATDKLQPDEAPACATPEAEPSEQRARVQVSDQAAPEAHRSEKHTSRRDPNNSSSHHKSSKSSRSRPTHWKKQDKERSRHRDGDAARDCAYRKPREQSRYEDGSGGERDLRRHRELHDRHPREGDGYERPHKRRHRDRAAREYSDPSRWSTSLSISPRRRTELSQWPRWDQISPRNEPALRTDRQRPDRPAAARAGGADRRDGATREPHRRTSSDAVLRPPVFTSPAAAAGNMEITHGAEQHEERSTLRAGGNDHQNDLRYAAKVRSGVRGHSSEGRRGLEHAHSAAPHSHDKPDMTNPGPAQKQGKQDHCPPGEPRTGGDARIGQFLPRRAAATEAPATVPQQAGMQRQGSAGEAAKQQPGQMGGFLARSNSSAKGAMPRAVAKEAGHFLVRHHSAQAGTGRAAGEVGPPVKHDPVGRSSSATTKQTQKVNPAQKPGFTVSKAGVGNACPDGSVEETARQVSAQAKSMAQQPQAVAVKESHHPVIKEVEPKTDEEAWFTPAPEAAQGPSFRSPFEYWGINAPLTGPATFRHKKQWLKAEFLPVQLTNVLLRGREIRIKLFFAKN